MMFFKRPLLVWPVVEKLSHNWCHDFGEFSLSAFAFSVSEELGRFVKKTFDEAGHLFNFFCCKRYLSFG